MRYTHFLCAMFFALLSLPLGLQASEVGWQPAESTYLYCDHAYDVSDVISIAAKAQVWRPSDPLTIVGTHAGKQSRTTYATKLRTLALLRSQQIHKPPV